MRARTKRVTNPGSWRRELAGRARNQKDIEHLAATSTDPRAREAAARFPLAVTPYYLSLIDPDDAGDPIARMVLPDPRELEATPGLTADPIDEARHAPLPGVIRRYPDRALLLVSDDCPAFCRFCTRRVLGAGRLRAVSGDELDAAVEWIRRRPEIRDVLVSGGDPLALSDDALSSVLEKLRARTRVDILRLATRAPVTLPSRVDRALAHRLAAFGPLYVSTHFNHPREVTPAARRALAHLADAGLPLANQTVLLRGVNDDAATIEALCRALLAARVRPYYLCVGDLVAGTGHLRTSIARGREIVRRLRGRLSGLGIPELVVDLPGGRGKVPVGPDHAVELTPGRAVLRAPDGELVEVADALDDAVRR